MPDIRLYSKPVQLHWAGFETDTYKLQQQGWELSAEQELYDRTMRIALRHQQAGMYGISEKIDWDYFHEDQSIYSGFQRPTPKVPIRMMSKNIMVEVMYGKSTDFSFQPIDARPQYMETTRMDISDLVHFAPLRAKGILLPEASVPELMDQILKLQQPMREREILRDLKTTPIVHAQIMSLAA
jgi:hypothetical protein